MKTIKRAVCALFSLLFIIGLCSCASAESLYGTWYTDADGKRNAIQFYEGKDGKPIFLWVIYDLENKETDSQSAGYYKLSGQKLTFEFSNSEDKLTVSYAIDGDVLTLSSQSVKLELVKYTLDSTGDKESEAGNYE